MTEMLTVNSVDLASLAKGARMARVRPKFGKVCHA